MFVGESTFPGRIFKVSLDGKVLGVIGRSGRQLKQFSGAHQLACPSENEVYVAETLELARAEVDSSSAAANIDEVTSEIFEQAPRQCRCSGRVGIGEREEESSSP